MGRGIFFKARLALVNITGGQILPLPTGMSTMIFQGILTDGKAFVQFTQGQIMELLGGDYGKIDILWLDGGQVQKLTEEEVYRYIDQIQNMPREDVYKYIMSTGYKSSKIQSQDITDG